MKKSIILIIVAVFVIIKLPAQTPTDHQMMAKGTACVLAQYSSNSWTEYWEHNLLRDNPNLGKVTTQTAMLMAVAGVGEHTNIFVGLPYIKTAPSEGSFMGQSGLQDLSATVKYRVFNRTHGFNLIGTIGGSMPTNKYVADYMPFSIGNGCKTATARLILNIKSKNGYYATTSAGYTFRSNITIDRDSYLAFNKIYNTNVVPVPNEYEISARLGYVKSGWQIEANGNHFEYLSGDNIRRNDMPFPTNGMKGNVVGAFLKYHPKTWGAQFAYNKVLSGVNVGKASTYSIGALYQFDYATKSKN